MNFTITQFRPLTDWTRALLHGESHIVVSQKAFRRRRLVGINAQNRMNSCKQLRFAYPEFRTEIAGVILLQGPELNYSDLWTVLKLRNTVTKI